MIPFLKSALQRVSPHNSVDMVVIHVFCGDPAELLDLLPHSTKGTRNLKQIMRLGSMPREAVWVLFGHTVKSIYLPLALHSKARK
jgi:hypothetical protein